jgi:hypothetical protein
MDHRVKPGGDERIETPLPTLPRKGGKEERDDSYTASFEAPPDHVGGRSSG